MTNTLHPLNPRMVHYYFRGRWAPELDRLVKCTMYKTWTTTSTPLDDLIRAQMKEKEKRLSLALERISFDIDGAESLELVKESGRIEKVSDLDTYLSALLLNSLGLQDLFPILYLILLRHANMIKLAKTVVLDDREFLDASSTLNHIFDAVHIRLGDLEGVYLPVPIPEALTPYITILESLRGWDIDASSVITRYAGGVVSHLRLTSITIHLTCLLIQYKFLYQQKIPNDLGGIVDDDYVEDVTAILNKSSIDVKELRFGAWGLNTSGYEKESELENDLELVMSPILSGRSVVFPEPTNTGPGADPFLNRVISRLETLTTNECFRFAKCTFLPSCGTSW